MDYITIVAKGTLASKFGSYFYTTHGSLGTLNAPVELGDFEIRYLNENEDKVFAAAPVKLVPVEIVLEAPEKVKAGATFDVLWSGPGETEDWITIVKVGTESQGYTSYKYVHEGSPLQLTAPEEPWDYEIRYASERVEGVFARRAIRAE